MYVDASVDDDDDVLRGCFTQGSSVARAASTLLKASGSPFVVFQSRLWTEALFFR